MKKYILIMSVILLLALASCSPSVEEAHEEGEEAHEEGSEEEEGHDEEAERAQLAEGVEGNLVTVEIKNLQFEPQNVKVEVGDTVVWINEDSMPHTVESTDGTFKSGELAREQSFRHTFTEAGKFNYACGIHTAMIGSVTVR